MWVFAIMQMVARIFLIGEWATSMVIAAEEFPAERRGMVIGVVSATAGLGSVVCAGVVPPLTHAVRLAQRLLRRRRAAALARVGAAGTA